MRLRRHPMTSGKAGGVDCESPKMKSFYNRPVLMGWLESRLRRVDI